MLRLSTVLALAAPATAFLSQEQGAGYAKLIELFKNLKTEAATTSSTESGNLENKKESCSSEIGDLKAEIAKQQKLKAEAEASEKETLDAIAGLEKQKAREEDLRDAAIGGLAAAEGNYKSTKARMEFDLAQLSGAVQGLDTALATVDTNAVMAADTKSKLKSTMDKLRQKMGRDETKLGSDIQNAAVFHTQSVKDLETQRDGHISQIGEMAGELGTQRKAAAKFKQDKVTAVSEVNANNGALKDKSSECTQTIRTLDATIEDADTRVKALDSALNILGEASFTPAPSVGGSPDADNTVATTTTQTSTSGPKLSPFEAGTPPEYRTFLQTSSTFLQSRDPTRPLLDLIAKCGKTSTVASLLRTALGASPSQVEAFQKIRGEIDNLSNTMYAQQQQDEKDLSWCTTTDKKLNQSIEELSTRKTELLMEHAALTGTAETLGDQIVEHKGAVQSFLDESETDHTNLMKDLNDNKVELEQLHKDHSNLEQARITLGKIFKGRTESGGAIVLEETDKVIADYDNSITENEQTRRSLEQLVETTAKSHEQNIKNREAAQKRDEVLLGEKSAGALKAQDTARLTSAELSTAQKTFDSIYTADDGKCKSYVEVFKSRREERKKEIDNLGDAKKALQSYMESIGIRM